MSKRVAGAAGTDVVTPPARAGARPLRPTRAEIDLDAIAHNVREVRELVAPAEVVAVVKADGYGHGAVAVARTALAAGATRLAVALLEEAEELREAGVTAPILLLSEPNPEAAGRTVAAGVVPTLYTVDFGEALRIEAGRRGRPIRVHVKADTGMARVGVPPAEWDSFLEVLRAWPALEVEALWTHLACADTPGDPTVPEQLDRFDQFLEIARSQGFQPTLIHVANSAAALTLKRSHRDAVRLGIAMYGCPPSSALAGAGNLRPALRLVTEVAFAKRIEAGTPVSYGHTWRAPEGGWLATLPIGYADGLPRLLSNRAEVLVAGKRRPVVGTVCMDQILVWCGEQEVALGDEVVLIGRRGREEISVLDWAQWARTITYEIVTGLGPRVPRVYRGPSVAGEE
ncbi:MAG: alanine racemase [Actinomycetota bacterium]|nr:alanine racemase [Actinomycetota bacterium]